MDDDWELALRLREVGTELNHQARVKLAENLVASQQDRVRVGPVMTKVAILPEPADTGQLTYRAIAGGRQSSGKTAGEALDVLTASLPAEAAGTLVIVQHHRPDEFFSAAQQARLNELMARWRSARDAGAALPSAEQAELDDLVEAEVRAAGERTAAVLREFGQ